MRLLLAFVCGIACAVTEGLKIEVLLFENMDAPLSTLQGAFASGVPVQKSALPMPGPHEPGPTHLLTDADLELTDLVKKLRKTHNYRPIVHFAWQQPIEKQNQAPLYTFTAGEQFSLPKQDAYSHHLDPIAGAQMMPEVSGVVSLSKGKFGHFYCDLLIHKVIQEKEGEWTAGKTAELGKNFTSLKSFRVKHERKMKAAEVVYLDHPLYGMLVQFTPIDLDAQNPVLSAQTPPHPDGDLEQE